MDKGSLALLSISVCGPEKNTEIVYFLSQCFCYVFKVYGHPADDDVRGDTSGSFQTLCLVQLGNSVDDGVQTDDRTVEEDARRLWRVNIQLRIMYIVEGNTLAALPFPTRGVQRRMISVDIFFVFLRLLLFALLLLYVT